MRSLNRQTLKEVKNFIDSFYKAEYKYPTIRQIATGVDISVGSAHRYVKELSDTGVIRYVARNSMETDVTRKVNTDRIPTALVGTIACGTPTLAEENIEEYVDLPSSIFGTGEFFILRASGDSMIEVGIDSGDLVVVKRQSYARAGEIVVALLETETTLKTYYPEPSKNRIRLHPENSSMKDIIVKSCEIQGVATHIIKKVRKKSAAH
ncbi:MAG: transcriptional repressor LexA [Eubacteriales bacterium]